MSRIIRLSLFGFVAGVLWGPLFAWWVIHPHDSFAGGGYAAMFAVPIGAVSGLLTGFIYARYHLRKSGELFRVHWGYFSLALFVSVTISIVVAFVGLGTPISYFWKAFLPAP